MEQADTVTNFCDFISYFIDIWLPQLELLSPKPNAVLLPCAIAIENLKISCVQRKISLANIRFFTPISLKSFLQESLTFPSSEDKNYVISRKVLKFWARNILKSDSDRRNILLQATGGEEGIEAFLEAFEFWRQIPPFQRPLFFDADFSFFAGTLDQFLSQHHWVISIEEAYGQVQPREKLFHDTLIGGFSPQAWNSLSLLKVLVKLSNHSTVRNLLSGDPSWDALWQQATCHLENYVPSSSSNDQRRFLQTKCIGIKKNAFGQPP
ncbi:MAG: hypothetical protein LBG98_03435 [Puniceicoccales bacterium]|jgi:hypothetical protein|nr:hypothetical protein [Puniceicoccales bacterium]